MRIRQLIRTTGGRLAVFTMLALCAAAAIAIAATRDGSAGAKTPSERGGEYARPSAQSIRRTTVRPLTRDEQVKLASGLRAFMKDKPSSLPEKVTADGGVTVELDRSFDNVAIARKDDAGNIEQTCVDDRIAAAAFLGVDTNLVGGKRRASKESAWPNQVLKTEEK